MAKPKHKIGDLIKYINRNGEVCISEIKEITHDSSGHHYRTVNLHDVTEKEITASYKEAVKRKPRKSKKQDEQKAA